MGKKELKKQYTELEFNLVDMVSLLDTTPTKKLTPFLVKQFNDWLQYRPDEKMNDSSEYSKMRRTLGDPKNELDEIIKRMVFKWAQPKLEIINEFTEHMEANRLVENDINKYENWNAIKLAVNEAEIKQGVKNKKNRVMVLHQDEEWIILKPLSMEASINYGYGTKWCTSMRDSNSYFHKYSRNGVLVFAINRKNGVKYAFYSSPKEYSVWTTTDARIDSMETTIPFELLGKVKAWTNFDEVGPNYNYFEEEDKEGIKKSKLMALSALRVGRDSDEPVETTFNILQGDSNEDVMEERMEEDVEEMAVPSNGNVITPNETVSFRADGWVTEQVTEEHMLMNRIRITENPPHTDRMGDVWDNIEEEMDGVYVDISDRGEQMVDISHSTHGSITEQGERTWSNPYPSGVGGGFNVGGEMVEEMESMDEESYDDMETPQSEH